MVRAPLVAGQPITNTAIVHANAAGFMAAMLKPGMRAVSITITTDSGAGGFILPNDRVDLILTAEIQRQSAARARPHHPAAMCACWRWTRPSSRTRTPRP